MYRVTQLIPVPIAQVDGSWVRYSDYLMKLRSDIHYLEREDAANLQSNDGREQRKYLARQALNKSEDNVYIKRLARENKLSVSNQEVDEFIDRQLKNRKPQVSRTDYEKVIRNFYDWSPAEYQDFVRAQLLRKKVEATIDRSARERAANLLSQVNAGADFAELARTQSDDDLTKAAGGDVGVVEINEFDPTTIISTANSLAPGQIANKLYEGSEGFYIIKTTAKAEGSIRYSRILVKYTELTKRLAALRSDKKIAEYVSIDNQVAPVNQTEPQ